MKILLVVGAVLLLAIVVASVMRVQRALGNDIVKSPGATKTQPATSPLDFVVRDIDGNDLNLAEYRGKVVLIVNVASKCGFTKQYAGLQTLYEKYADRGFVVIGFPANNFGGQEPGTEEQIKNFCTTNYNVTFPMMAKISVAGEDKHPLYRHLTEPATAGEFAGEIGWNFTKFLIDRDGQVYARFGSKTDPMDPKLVDAIERGLK